MSSDPSGDHTPDSPAAIPNQDFLQLIEAAIGVGTWSYHAASKRLTWSPSIYQLHELDERKTPDIEQSTACFLDEGGERFRTAMDEALLEGKGFDLKLPFRTPSGKRLWVQVISHPIVEAGQTVWLQGLYRDITAQQIAQRTSDHHQQRFHALFESLATGLILIDETGTTLEANPAASHILGERPERLIGLSLDAVFSDLGTATGEPCDLRAEWDRLRQADGGTYHQVLTRSTPTATQWLDLQMAPLVLGEQARDVSCYLLFKDISKERDILQRATFLTAIVQSASDAVIGLGEDLHIRSWNAAAQKLYGYTAAEAIGQSIQLIVESEQPEVEARFEFGRTNYYQTRLPKAVETIHRRRDGTPLHVLMHAFTLYDDQKQHVGRALMVRDMSQQKELEAQLHQAMKMDAIGQLASGVAHDFNNLLTVILGQAHMIQETAELEKIKERTEHIVKSAERAKTLTSQLLSFSRKQDIAPCPLDLNAHLYQLTKMLYRLIGEDIDLQVDLAPGLPTIKADPGQLDQIIINLVVNARDAIPTTGTLTLRTGLVKLDLDSTQSRNLVPGDYVRLWVSDSGTGMDAATLEHIFEPFFTTKPEGKGTGLGLPMVFQIMRQYGGDVGVKSEPGVGTTIYLTFPICGEPVEGELPPENANATGAAGQHILLVEDEPNLRSLCREILDSKGFHVSVASNGPEALAILDRQTAEIQLVVTDLIMPGTEVQDYVQALYQRLASNQVLFITGYADRNHELFDSLPSEQCLLHKPFMPSQLLQAIDVLLSS